MPVIPYFPTIQTTTATCPYIHVEVLCISFIKIHIAITRADKKDIAERWRYIPGKVHNHSIINCNAASVWGRTAILQIVHYDAIVDNGIIIFYEAVTIKKGSCCIGYQS